MLVLSQAETRKIRKLFQRLERGTLTREEALLRALDIDPFDFIALLGLAAIFTAKDSTEEARRFLWRAIEAEPARCDAYLHLTASYAKSDPELGGSLTYLTLRRALQSPGRISHQAEEWLAGVRADLEQKIPGMDEDKLPALSETLARSRPDEPERVAALLLPYRLIQEVIDRPAEGMSRDAVDRILDHGSACVSLLIGVLRGWARGGKGKAGPSAAAALALLGEIGDTAALPSVRECMDTQDPSVSTAALWAAQRMTARHDADDTVYTVCCSPLKAAEIDDEPRNSDEGVEQDGHIARMLLEFATENIKSGELQQALKMFYGHDPPEEMASDDQMRFWDWLLNDYTPHRFRRTIPQEYLARHRERLTAADRRALQDWTNSYTSLFEVQDVRKGVGVELKDLLLEGNIFVYDVTSSHSMARWDFVLTRVRPEGNRMVFTAVGMRITPEVCQELRDSIVEDREASGLDWIRYLRANSHHIRRQCEEIYDEKRKNMRFVTAEGDDLIFSKAAYRVLDRDRVLSALEDAKLIDERRDEDGTVRFTWYETAEITDKGRRSLGSLTLEGERLLLECTSRQRLKRGMAMIQKLAGGVLEEKLTEFKTPQSAMNERPKSAPEQRPQPAIPPEVERRLITEYKQRHFKTWPDIHLPALDGLTPREAARDAEGRPLLIALLKSLENAEEHDRMEGRGWFDVAQLKAELGVDY